MKKLLACCICCALILGFAGCGESQTLGKGNSNAELISIVVGEWVRYSGDKTEYETITVKEDGSADLSNGIYSWNLTDESAKIKDITKVSRFYIELSDDKKEVVEKLMFQRNYDYKNEPDGTYIMKVENANDCFCNKKVFDVVDITMSNFFEYFESRDLFFAHKDEFGDYTDSFEFSRGWALKENFNVDATKSEISYKCTHTTAYFDFEFNKETGDYKILNSTGSYNDVMPDDGHFAMDENSGVFFASVGMPQVTADTMFSKSGYSLISCPQNIELGGVIGKLYLYK